MRKILFFEDAAMAEAIAGTAPAYLPLLQSVADAHAALGMPGAVDVDAVIGHMNDPAGFDAAYREWFYDTNPSINQLPIEKATVLPNLRLPATLGAFMDALEALRTASAAVAYYSEGREHTLALSELAGCFAITKGKVALDAAKLEQLADTRCRRYLSEPVHLRIHDALQKAVAELNTLPMYVLGSALFGESAFARNAFGRIGFDGLLYHDVDGFRCPKDYKLRVDLEKIAQVQLD